MLFFVAANAGGGEEEEEEEERGGGGGGGEGEGERKGEGIVVDISQELQTETRTSRTDTGSGSHHVAIGREAQMHQTASACLQILHTLLAARADVHATDKFGETAIFRAVSTEQEKRCWKVLPLYLFLTSNCTTT